MGGFKRNLEFFFGCPVELINPPLADESINGNKID